MPEPAQPPEPTIADILAALRHVVREIRQGNAEVLARLDALETGRRVPFIASDAELDYPTGNAEIGRDPKRWKGAPLAPCRMADCPPDYLDLVADYWQWRGDNPMEGKAQYATSDLRMAALARGWARRKRKAEDEEL